MRLCRGPLPDGHPKSGTLYFSVDHDVAALACNLRVTPAVETLRLHQGDCVLLDAHRAPDEWFALASTMPRLTVQGDPQAARPRTCTLFAQELETQSVQSTPLALKLEYVPRLSAAMPMMQGKSIVLVGSYLDIAAVYAHLRPQGIVVGDVVQDFYGKSYRVTDASSANHLFVDDGRKALLRNRCAQHLVVSPGSVRASEYDTVVVMPGVAPSAGKSVCRRCRYQIIAVCHSPFGYSVG